MIARGHDEQVLVSGGGGRTAGRFSVVLLRRGFAFTVSFLHEILQAFGADGDDEVSLVDTPAQPRHLTLFTDLQVLPEIQRHLSIHTQTERVRPKEHASGAEDLYTVKQKGHVIHALFSIQ